MNYYNEFDPKAAAWLRELIRAGLIPTGDVDTRSITEIKPHELTRYTQCHFFAGVGGWSLALQLAGWDPARPVWTGSCPCQPFSSAGKQLGTADERHLWPVFFNLIRKCRPLHVFGEQVASAIGKGWLDGVSSDLEGAGYACGATVLGAHSVGAPHIRQRLFWVADATGGQREQPIRAQGHDIQRPADNGATGGLADASTVGRERRPDAGRPIGQDEGQRGEGLPDTRGGCVLGGLADSDRAGPQPGHAATEADRHGRAVVADGGDCGLSDPGSDVGRRGQHVAERGPQERASDRRLDAWSRFDLIPCADGKTRRIEPGLAPLVAGLPRGVVPSCDPRREGYAQNTAEARVTRLRGYGNSIVPQLAAEFIAAFLES